MKLYTSESILLVYTINVLYNVIYVIAVNIDE